MWRENHRRQISCLNSLFSLFPLSSRSETTCGPSSWSRWFRRIRETTRVWWRTSTGASHTPTCWTWSVRAPRPQSRVAVKTEAGDGERVFHLFIGSFCRALSSQADPAGRAAGQPDRRGRERRGLRVSRVQRPAASHPVAQTHHGQRQQGGAGRTPLRPRPQGGFKVHRRFHLSRRLNRPALILSVVISSICSFYQGAFHSLACGWRHILCACVSVASKQFKMDF